MSIDEAIAKYKEITNTDANCPAHCNISCDKCVQESEQIAEWLEELKAIKDGCIPIIHGKAELELHDKAIRTKAIDDFVQVVKKHDWNIRNRNENEFIYGAIDRLAEQLKVGGENEQSIFEDY